MRAEATDFTAQAAAASAAYRLSSGEAAAAEAYEALVVGEPSADLLYECLRGSMRNLVSRGHRNPHVSFDVWSWSYLAEASIIATTTFGQSRFAQLVWETFDASLKSRDVELGRYDEVRQRQLRSWGRGDHRPGAWTAVVTSAGRMAFPVLRLAGLALAHPEAGLDHPSRPQFVGAASDALSEFDEDYRTTGTGELGYYDRPTRGDIEPLNHALSAGRAWLELAALQKEDSARRRAAQLARFFRWAMWEDDAGALVWAYQPTPDRRKTRRPNLVWKADVDLAFALLAADHQVVFTKTEVEQLLRTFNCNIWLPDGSINSYIARTKLVPLEDKFAKVRDRVDGFLTWNVLGRWDPAITKHVDRQLFEHTTMFSKGWFGRPRATLAYAQRCLVKAERERPGF